MKLLYAHDHKLRYFENGFYTTGGFSDQVTNRYTSVFENMVLLCRAIKSDNIGGCSRIGNANVDVCPLFCGKVLPTKANLRLIQTQVMAADVVMVRLPSLLGLYTAFIAFANKKKVCVEVVGSAWGSYWYKSFSGKIAALPLEVLNKCVIKNAAYVLYVTDDYLQKEYPTKGVSVGCSDVVLDVQEIDVLNRRLEKIKKWAENSIVLGTLGQIDYKYKGHKTVLQVIAELKKLGVKVEYRLAGNGSRGYIEGLALKYGVLDNIKFYGQISHEEINQWIDELDVYVQPSLTEGMPRSVIEAIYRATPTIVSDAGGMYELVESDSIFKAGSVEHLFEIIRKLSNKKMLSMAQRNYIFCEKFDCNKLSKKRESFYTRIKEEVKYGVV